MKHLQVNGFYFMLFLGMCSCTGCDIDRTEVSLSKANPDVQLIDLTTGKCLVNEIDADISRKQKSKLTNLMAKRLEEIFGDSVVHINTKLSSRFKEKIPFEISDGKLDTLRSTTTYTYLFNIRAVKPGISGDHASVEIVIFDLDTRNTIYSQRVLAAEYEPERENSGFTFWLSHSDYDLIKSALKEGLRDLKRGVKKFNRSSQK